jgi:hypothetical protein
LNLKNTTYLSFYEKVKGVCGTSYQLYLGALSGKNNSKHYTQNEIDSICFKSVYTLTLVRKIFHDLDIYLIFPSSNLTSVSNNEENSLLLNNQFLNSSDFISLIWKISFIFMFILHILIVVFFESFTDYIGVQYFLIQLNKAKIDYKIVDTLINSVPVKNFVFTNKKTIREIKMFSQKEIFINFTDYKQFFNKLINQNEELFNVLNLTLEKRAKLSASIYLTMIFIFILLILFFVVWKIYNFIIITKSGGTFIFLIYIFGSYLLILILIQFLKLISHIDTIKYLSSQILSNRDRTFLEEEASEDFLE